MSKEMETEKKISIPTGKTRSKKLFGTDGIRGKAGSFPMTPDLVLKVGQALGYLLTKGKQKSETTKVVIGKDTRLSGYMVEQALASGLNSVGVHVQLIGPLPTPGIGYLAQNMRADAGIIISASHNAYYDNGIKIFRNDGFKISDETEEEIEKLVLEADLNDLLVDEDHIGRTKRIEDAAGRYIVYAKNAFPLNLSLEGVRIVLDCANGAAYKVAPMVFTELGAEVIVLSDKPDGFNINRESGALHPEALAEAVKKYRADLGIALDGDADRIIMVDEEGKVVNGDAILAVAAIHFKETGFLKQDKVIATSMSNLALDELLNESGIEVIRVGVGDKNVVKAMRDLGVNVGGEQSGHIIFLDHATTGDGIVASLKVLEVMQSKKVKLSSLSNRLKPYPQRQINVKVKVKKELDKIPGYNELFDSLNAKLKSGRIMVRYSGTEPLVRILVEGRKPSLISEVATEMERFLKKELL
ncbi:MAG: phosphoglucosamine mutase [Bdellovibrionales bacterium]